MIRLRSIVAQIAPLLAILTSVSAGWAQLEVVQVSPRPNGLNAPLDTDIRIEFDRPIDPTTITNQTLGAFGRWSGAVEGTWHLTDDNRTVHYQPDNPFAPGELVSVNLSSDIFAADGSPIQPGGFTQQFWTRPQRVSNLSFTETAVMSTGSPSRPYGGVATDLNNDGWLDITMVNEDSADLRVYMNRADGSGSFFPYTTPTFAIGNRASPSEPADFNSDGNADLAVVNINDDTVSIVLGNGDGTFAPQQTINVGDHPRGIAVLDFDGDGDMDVANTNTDSSTLTLIENLGNGVFNSTPVTIDPGLNGEWSLMAGDMNSDGLSDLVVASGTGNQIRTLTSNGDGTFVPEDISPVGGRSWQIMLGDVNGDGNLDVASANGFSNNGSILLGNGDGTFGSRTIHNVASMGTGGNTLPLASDLGDIDGDGDLDWITSSFGGDWIVLENDGEGNFSFLMELQAPDAASCSLMADFDNDGDLDLAMIDELDNLIILRRNDGTHCELGDFDCDGNFNAMDIDQLVAAIVAGDAPLIYDLTGDGLVDSNDLDAWLIVGGAANLPGGAAYEYGDANLDGVVDGEDFAAWSANKFSKAFGWSAADFDANGVVDGHDFLRWNANKSLTPNAVPEAGSHWLMLVAFSLLATRCFSPQFGATAGIMNKHDSE